MENRNILKNKQLLAGIGIVILAVFMRLMPHDPNFAPIGALALFAGAHFTGKSKYLIPFFAMVISDMVLGFHDTMIFVYGSFFLILLIGSLLKKHHNPYHLLGASFASSLLFFFITNFGVWITSSMYEKTGTGLMQAYAMGLPFFRNTITSDLFYSFAFFYGYFLIQYLIQKSVYYFRIFSADKPHL